MTYSKIVTIFCDGESERKDCHGTFGDQVYFRTATTARESAHEEGWVTRGTEDFCPECK